MKTIDWDLISHYTNKDISRSARVMYSSKGTSNDVERVRDRSWGRVKFTKFTKSSGYFVDHLDIEHLSNHSDTFWIIQTTFRLCGHFSYHLSTFHLIRRLFGSFGHFSDPSDTFQITWFAKTISC